MPCEQLPEQLTLAPAHQCQGTVRLPGSKSIANRALLLAAISDKPVILHNLLRSDDTERMLEALRSLGVATKELSPTQWRINGCGGHWPVVPERLALGNAGTAMRPLTAVLAATLQATQQITLDGDKRMRERPLAHLIEALQAGQANITCHQQAGYPPLTVAGGLSAGTFSIDGSVSSQFISALLMALPLLERPSELQLTGNIVSKPYIELTLAMLRDFGIEITAVGDNAYQIAAPQSFSPPDDYLVEGDASAASYWMAAAAIAGGPVRIMGIGRHSIQGDVAFADAVQAMGAKVTWLDGAVEVVADKPLQGIDFDGNDIPDAAMTLAPLALFANGPTIIRNVANWRVKETDRLAALATELRKIGANVEEGADYLRIQPPAQWHHAEVDTYDDHRIAMCMALVAFSPVGVSINDPACCGKTYPEFFTEFSRLCNA